MQGLALLLVLCLGGYVAFGVVLVARTHQTEAQRAGYYGRAPRERVEQADAVDAVIADMAAFHRLDELAELIAHLDRLAWGGVRVTDVRPATAAGRWTIEFDDGTSLLVGTDDTRALRRAAHLASRDAVVVSRVQPLEVSAFVELYSTGHGTVRLALHA